MNYCKLFTNKYVTLLSIILLSGCNKPQHPNAENQRRIAILTPVTHAALEEIISGFKTTISADIACTFDIYNAHGDRVLLRNQAEKIARESYDLAFVVATQPSIIMKEVCSQRASNLPVVCAAVDDPVANGIVDALTSSGNNFTTVTEGASPEYYTQQLTHIQQLFPQMKKLILIYSPSVMLDKEKDHVQASCNKRGIQLSVLPIYASHELAQKATLLIPGHDGVIILKDNLIVSCLESLITITNRLRVPLCASDLNSLDAGATCAYGVYEYAFGSQAAQQAYAILHDKKHPSEVPSSRVDNYLFKIHEKAVKALSSKEQS